jgi:cell wall-associated NlpC family hydrolase
MKVSLALLTIPILFSGCMQEKASKVSPESKDKNHTKRTKQEIKTLKTISSSEILQVNNDGIKILKIPQETNNPTLLHVSNNGVKQIPQTAENNPIIDSTILDELALNIQNSMEMDISGSKELTTESLEVGESWVAFTKKDEILETAKEYLGVKYIWAANGPSAFDCSGYTKYVFKKNGITIPRYSGHQANVGIKVSFNELQKGDLVFFDTAKGFHGKVNHVGIYIGDNKFIHASSAKKQVMITSFSRKKFYKNRFLHGQRIIQSDTSLASYTPSQQVHTN